jgi:hypothetical protein
MARGDVQLSPWFNEFADNTGLKVTISVAFNEATRAIQSAVIHRDDGCQWTRIVFDDPNDDAKAKRLTAPADGAGDRTYTRQQINSQGLSTIEQAMGLQITAAP